MQNNSNNIIDISQDRQEGNKLKRFNSIPKVLSANRCKYNLQLRII